MNNSREGNPSAPAEGGARTVTAGKDPDASRPESYKK